MATSPYPIEQFGGLDFRDPLEVGATGATTCRDVAFEIPGQFRTRDGYASLATTVGTPKVLHAHPGGLLRVIASSDTRLEAFDVLGASVSSVLTGGGPHSLVTYGSPGTTATYTAGSSFGDTSVRKFDGTTWSVVAAAPVSTTWLGMSPRDNRLVACGTGTSSNVRFSSAGDAETWPATNFVQLAPGDGENFCGMATYGDLLFVFKQSKFFVFYGNSTDSAGNPIFNYRSVETGIGAAGINYQRGITSSPRGVYFVALDGVYLTQGGAPVRVSTPLNSLFRAGGAFERFDYASVGYSRGRLLFHVGRTSTARYETYVYFEDTDRWARWVLANSQRGGNFMSFAKDSGDDASLLYFVTGNDLAIYTMSAARTTDAGVAISWDYTSGYYDLGDQRRKVVNWSDVTGTGTVTLQMVAEGAAPNRVADTGSSVVLGTSPTVATTRRRRATSGTRFQHKLTGTGAATVSLLTHAVDNARQN